MTLNARQVGAAPGAAAALVVLAFGSGTVAAPATANTTGRTSLNVPRDYPTIHAALDAARTRSDHPPLSKN